MATRVKKTNPATPAAPQTQQAKTDERAEKGQFAAGNRGGPGNPFNRQLAAFRKKMIETVTEDDVEAITREVIAMARERNPVGLKLFHQYVMGKPAAPVDPDRTDVDEWRLLEESNVGGESAQAVLVDGMPVRLATRFAGIMEEAKVEKMKKQVAENEVRLAEEARIAAAEQAAFERGVEESIRQYREQHADGKAAAAEAELHRPMTLEEIVGGPLANGGNGEAASRTVMPAGIPTASEIRFGGEAPSANGDNGRAAGATARGRGKRRRGQCVVA